MPRTTEIITARLARDTAARVRAAAAATGRSVSKYISDLVAAAVGGAGESR
jgi:uncharacterized protein (DUF1778 family)